MECANSISLWQTIVLAAMNDKLRRRPLMHIVDRVVLFEQFPRFLIPRTPTPVMVELYSWLDKSRWPARTSDVVAHKEKLIGGVTIVGRVKDAIVAYKGLEVEPILGMTLNPAVPQISTRNATTT